MKSLQPELRLATTRHGLEVLSKLDRFVALLCLWRRLAKEGIDTDESPWCGACREYVSCVGLVEMVGHEG
jgi:hypothetical protein